MVKGILKRYSDPASSRFEINICPPEEIGSPKKRVSFDSLDLVKVFEADEWDRSPVQVTLKLTYRDVAELRELNISLIRPCPLAMERTKSKRPIPRSATTQSPSLNLSILSDRSALQSSIPTYYPRDVARPSSLPSKTPSSSSMPFALSSQHLSGLLEDTIDALTVSSTVVDDNLQCDEFEENSSPLIRPPPGLPVRISTTNAYPSPVPSLDSYLPNLPMVHSKPLQSATTAIPLYRPPHLRTKFADSFFNPVAVSTVTRNLSEKIVIDPGTRGIPILPSSNLKASKLVNLEGKAESVSLVLNKNCDKGVMSVSLPPVPVLSRKPSRGLMGWELKRSINTPGKLGFGLVRKQSDAQK